ncbi:MAG: hypothetical protein M1818_003377 [Claussenomyces sp. TS43310]|nr:MAG: hypothetical protein M1818_003377 [Claussenomyces sp. TS43310]
MRVLRWLCLTVTAVTLTSAQSTAGLLKLVERRLPNHANDFTFSLIEDLAAAVSSNSPSIKNDAYSVSSSEDGKIHIEGTSLSALSKGLHHYLTDVAHVDIYWYIGSRLLLTPPILPSLSEPLVGNSVVPFRYHFNTVTFSYTTAFWTWEDWELELDWLALRGVNLPLAWVGTEKILLEVFREIGLADSEIFSFFSGPAFQAWSRFGNIHGSWGGALPISWIEAQFELQIQIVRRMIELGMTPVIPAFTGFVPAAISRVAPHASVVNGSAWEGFPTKYTNTTFLEPVDPLFAQLQTSFITKQTAALGNISHIYTLDQFNENNPSSGDTEYLRNVSYGTWQSLKSADPSAIWLMQGWLFFSNSVFWTSSRIQAYLSGVETDSDMLLLDLFSESQPQWERTNSYYGKPWIWCELHDYGGNMGLYGQILNVTVNPIEALAKSSSLAGFGLTMEGQEGNEIVYDLLLDQAWSGTAIDTRPYFYNWVTNRYTGSLRIPAKLYSSWELLRTTVYSNTDLTSNAVTKSIFEIAPSTSGLVDRTGHHPTTTNYNTSVLVTAWNLMYDAALLEPSLWENPAYQYDLVDVTRQVMSNAFTTLYSSLITLYTSQTETSSSLTISAQGQRLIELLADLDAILLTNPSFLLSSWIAKARAWATANDSSSMADFYEYNARNQITLWGPDGEVNDYASKSWGGLVKGYYAPRWQIFVAYLASTTSAEYNATVLEDRLLDFGERWQLEIWGCQRGEVYGTVGDLSSVLPRIRAAWPELFEP